MLRSYGAELHATKPCASKPWLSDRAETNVPPGTGRQNAIEGVEANALPHHERNDMLDEQTDLDWAIASRMMMNVVPFGPLTKDEHESIEAYERYCEESEAEYHAQEAAGGRTICPQCGERKVVHRTVCTYGYVGHPGADYSDYGRCEGCGHEEL